MHFHEQRVDPHRHGRAGQQRNVLALTAGYRPAAAGVLHGMRRVEDHRGEAPHHVQPGEVVDQPLIAKGRSAVGQQHIGVARLAHLFGRKLHPLRREELPLLDVYALARPPAGDQQVGLTAQKRRNLQAIEHAAGRLGLRRLVNV